MTKLRSADLAAAAEAAAALIAQVPAFRAIGRMDVARVVRERSL